VLLLTVQWNLSAHLWTMRFFNNYTDQTQTSTNNDHSLQGLSRSQPTLNQQCSNNEDKRLKFNPLTPTVAVRVQL